MDDEIFIKTLKKDFPQFKVSLSNLSHPTTEFVTSFYVMILNVILQENKSFLELNDRQKEFLNMYQPEGTSLVRMAAIQNLWKVLRYTFQYSVGMEFTLSDLLFPERTKQRSRTFMTSLLNMHAYCAFFDDQIEIGTEHCDTERQELGELTEMKNQLEQRLANFLEDKVMYIEKTGELIAEVTALAEHNEASQSAVKEMYMKVEHVEKQIQGSAEREQELQDTVVKLDNQIKHLRSLILSDQNQILENHRVLTAKKEECLKNMNHLTSTSEATSLKNEQFDRIIELQQKTNSYLYGSDSQGQGASLKELHNQMSECNKQLKQQREEDAAVTSAIVETETSLLKLKEENSQLEAELAAISNKKRTRIGKLEEYIESQKKSLTDLSKTYGNLESKKKENELAVEQLKGECAQMEAKLHKIDEDNMEEYNAFMKAISEVEKSIQDKFKI